jgi:hypothetical protein
MKNCARCGSENPDDATFCSNCGSAFSAEETTPGSIPPPMQQPPATGMGLQAGWAAPPPPPYGQPPAAYPLQAPAPGAPYAPGPYPLRAQTSNGKATAALVLGIVGILFCPLVCSLLAIILGSTAKNEIAASGGYQTGESNARAGIILGWIGLAIGAIFGIIWAIAAASNATILFVSIF